MSMLSRIKMAVCELFHCNSFYLKERKARVVHNAHVAYTVLPNDTNNNKTKTNKQTNKPKSYIYIDNNNNQLKQIKTKNAVHCAYIFYMVKNSARKADK